MGPGDTFTFPDKSVTIQVEEVQPAIPTDPDLYGVLAKACVTADTLPSDVPFIAFSWTPWSVYGADGSRYANAGVSGGDLPTPTYPNGEFDGKFYPGDCTRGWMFFDVPDGDTVSQVRYDSTALNNQAVSARWTIPAK